ncbi:MAG: ribonuclease III [Opitutaceae bacterium]
MTDIHLLETRLGHRFKDSNILALALTHPSCDLEEGDNQRLEFLGDAVLDLVIAEALYNTFDSINEGTMDRVRASIVNGKSLARKAAQIELAEFLQVSDSHREHHPDPSKAMLEDALEAIFGAIFLDSGMDAARATILRLFGEQIEDADVSNRSKNPKGRLQEWTQQHYDGAIPEYTLTSEDGPDHDRQYASSVTINDKVLGEGRGSSKKAAESAAAIAALKDLQG